MNDGGPLRKVELSNGLVVDSHQMTFLQNRIMEVLEKDEKPFECDKCELWRCITCPYSQDFYYCSDCSILEHDCFITGTREETCKDLSQFTKILLEIL